MSKIVLEEPKLVTKAYQEKNKREDFFVASNLTNEFAFKDLEQEKGNKNEQKNEKQINERICSLFAKGSAIFEILFFNEENRIRTACLLQINKSKLRVINSTKSKEYSFYKLLKSNLYSNTNNRSMIYFEIQEKEKEKENKKEKEKEKENGNGKENKKKESFWCKFENGTESFIFWKCLKLFLYYQDDQLESTLTHGSILGLAMELELLSLRLFYNKYACFQVTVNNIKTNNQKEDLNNSNCKLLLQFLPNRVQILIDQNKRSVHWKKEFQNSDYKIKFTTKSNTDFNLKFEEINKKSNLQYTFSLKASQKNKTQLIEKCLNNFYSLVNKDHKDMKLQPKKVDLEKEKKLINYLKNKNFQQEKVLIKFTEFDQEGNLMMIQKRNPNISDDNNILIHNSLPDLKLKILKKFQNNDTFSLNIFKILGGSNEVQKKKKKENLIFNINQEKIKIMEENNKQIWELNLIYNSIQIFLHPIYENILMIRNHFNQKKVNNNQKSKKKKKKKNGNDDGNKKYIIIGVKSNFERDLITNSILYYTKRPISKFRIRSWKEGDLIDSSVDYLNNQFIKFLNEKDSDTKYNLKLFKKYEIENKKQLQKHNFYSKYNIILLDSIGNEINDIKIYLTNEIFLINLKKINGKIYNFKYTIFSQLFFYSRNSLIGKFNINQDLTIFLKFQNYEFRCGFNLDFLDRRKNILNTTQLNYQIFDSLVLFPMNNSYNYGDNDSNNNNNNNNKIQNNSKNKKLKEKGKKKACRLYVNIEKFIIKINNKKYFSIELDERLHININNSNDSNEFLLDIQIGYLGKIQIVFNSITKRNEFLSTFIKLQQDPIFELRRNNVLNFEKDLDSKQCKWKFRTDSLILGIYQTPRECLPRQALENEVNSDENIGKWDIKACIKKGSSYILHNRILSFNLTSIMIQKSINNVPSTNERNGLIYNSFFSTEIHVHKNNNKWLMVLVKSDKGEIVNELAIMFPKRKDRVSFLKKWKIYKQAYFISNTIPSRKTFKNNGKAILTGKSLDIKINKQILKLYFDQNWAITQNTLFNNIAELNVYINGIYDNYFFKFNNNNQCKDFINRILETRDIVKYRDCVHRRGKRPAFNVSVINSNGDAMTTAKISIVKSNFNIALSKQKKNKYKANQIKVFKHDTNDCLCLLKINSSKNKQNRKRHKNTSKKNEKIQSHYLLFPNTSSLKDFLFLYEHSISGFNPKKDLQINTTTQVPLTFVNLSNQKERNGKIYFLNDNTIKVAIEKKSKRYQLNGENNTIIKLKESKKNPKTKGLVKISINEKIRWARMNSNHDKAAILGKYQQILKNLNISYQGDEDEDSLTEQNVPTKNKNLNLIKNNAQQDILELSNSENEDDIKDGKGKEVILEKESGNETLKENDEKEREKEREKEKEKEKDKDEGKEREKKKDKDNEKDDDKDKDGGKEGKSVTFGKIKVIRNEKKTIKLLSSESSSGRSSSSESKSTSSISSGSESESENSKSDKKSDNESENKNKNNNKSQNGDDDANGGDGGDGDNKNIDRQIKQELENDEQKKWEITWEEQPDISHFDIYLSNYNGNGLYDCHVSIDETMGILKLQNRDKWETKWETIDQMTRLFKHPKNRSLLKIGFESSNNKMYFLFKTMTDLQTFVQIIKQLMHQERSNYLANITELSKNGKRYFGVLNFHNEDLYIRNCDDISQEKKNNEVPVYLKNVLEIKQNDKDTKKIQIIQNKKKLKTYLIEFLQEKNVVDFVDLCLPIQKKYEKINAPKRKKKEKKEKEKKKKKKQQKQKKKNRKKGLFEINCKKASIISENNLDGEIVLKWRSWQIHFSNGKEFKIKYGTPYKVFSNPNVSNLVKLIIKDLGYLIITFDDEIDKLRFKRELVQKQ
ncbi:bromodomain-containing protein [Anaeramoeba flamelloides]|uniref:Bromodomain-containing protein n=1 Tax=Anaeramoeba flamelloides TaxID=1746091 RepID=A0AAV7ZFP6_9EUKA|nr:bromodomain-containing protein [Anaeramoeba flamelloides]